MQRSSVVFLLKVVLVLPIIAVVACFDVWYHYARRITPSFVRRILMREAFLLGEPSVCWEVINPVFTFLDSLFIDKYQEVSANVKEVDRQLLEERFLSTDSLLNNPIKTSYTWYAKPAGFNPYQDPVLIFSHGGGFAIKLVPLSFNFLRNLSKAIPNMGIIIHDYTVTTEEQGTHPKQLLETLTLYDFVSKDLGCRNIYMMGESAGGNIVLGLLQHLYKSGRVLPRRAVLLSPWCNPTWSPAKHQMNGSLEYSLNKVMDALSSRGLGTFTEMLIPRNYRFEDDPLLDIERNFDTETWRGVLQSVQLLIVYGTDEILQHEIKDFISKLDNLRDSNFSLTDNVVVDENGGHIEPVLDMTLSLEKWSQENSIRQILEFLVNK